MRARRAIDVTEDLSIIGNGTFDTNIDGKPSDGVFDILPGATLTLADLYVLRQDPLPDATLTLTDRYVLPQSSNSAEAAILVRAHAALSGTRIYIGNHHGAGIFSYGRVTLRDVTPNF